MPQAIQFGSDIEPLVQFIEDTPRNEIVDRTLDKLRAGVPIRTMLTASVLAVTRSSDLPPGHHGGPLHPVAGLYPIWQLVQRLEGEDKFLPVLQHVALANKHVHDPVTSPFALLEFDAIDADGSSQSKAEFHFRMVEVVIMFLLPLLAVALAVPPKRSSSALGVFLSIVMIVTYHKINQYAEGIAALGKVNPVVALWTPFVLFSLLIWWMYHTLADKPGGQPIGALERGADKLAAAFRRWFGRRSRHLAVLP